MVEIIQFPKTHNKNKLPTQEDLKKSKDDFHKSYIEDVSDFMVNIILMETGRAGFNLNDDDINDVMLIADSIKSLMLKKRGIEHTLQAFSDDYQDFLTNGGEDDKVDEESEVEVEG